LALAGIGFGRASRAQSPKPNIVFVMADDLGYADVSCYGQRDYTTPNVDRLAIEGLRFTQGYANSAVCSATRTALATGRYQYRLPVGLEEPINASSPRNIGLPPSHPTLPSLLKKAGYSTALVGKWHLGFLPDFSPLKSGYDQFFGIFGGAADYFNHGADARRTRAEQALGVLELRSQGPLQTNLLGDRAVRPSKVSPVEEPFLMSLHFTAPHWPWEGPDDGPSQSASPSFTATAVRRDLRHHGAEPGRQYRPVLQALDASGLAGNTIVVFTSDNGGERFSKTWPFSGMKTELLEGGIRVPTIVRWPGRIAAGSVSEQVTITMDWVPTLLAAAGTAPDAAYPSDGEDLGPIMTGRAAPHSRKLYWRYKAGSQRAVRDGDWKYLRIADNEFLFDVVKDPRERGNLKDRQKDVFERLKTDWETWNGTMLPERPRPAAYSNSGNFLADHYGVINPAPAAPPGNAPTR
jgi:arylsulfatase A-like enzyme